MEGNVDAIYEAQFYFTHEETLIQMYQIIFPKSHRVCGGDLSQKPRSQVSLCLLLSPLSF